MQTPDYGTGGPNGPLPPPVGTPGTGGGGGMSGTILLVMGILGILCCSILAPVTWVLSNNAMTALNSGQGNEADRGMINVARILGIIGSVFLVLQVIWFFTVGIAAFTTARQMPPPGTPPTFQNVPPSPQ